MSKTTRLGVIFLASLAVPAGLALYAIAGPDEPAGRFGPDSVPRARGVDGGPGSRPGMPGMPGGPFQPRLTKDQEAELLKFLKDRRPEFYERLVRLQEGSTIRYRMTLSEAWRWYRDWQRMSPDDQKLAIEEQELRFNTFSLIKELRDCREDKQRAVLVDRLKEIVAKKFDVELKTSETRLNALEERLKSLRQELKDRAAGRDQHIAEEVDRHLKASTQPVPPPRRWED